MNLDSRIYDKCRKLGKPLPTAADKCRAIVHECCEMQNELAWKWWKDTKPDKEKAKEELVDILHFVISAAIDLGMDAECLFGRYLVKNQVNHIRQEDRA